MEVESQNLSFSHVTCEMVCDLFARNLAAIEDIPQRELCCKIIMCPGPLKEYFCIENLELRLEVYAAALAITILVM